MRTCSIFFLPVDVGEVEGSLLYSLASTRVQADKEGAWVLVGEEVAGPDCINIAKKPGHLEEKADIIEYVGVGEGFGYGVTSDLEWTKPMEKINKFL